MSRVEDQPPPKKDMLDQPHAWAMVMGDVRLLQQSKPGGRWSCEMFLLSDMAERDKVGVGRYGTHLQPNNGRNNLIDAYQEALDLCVYLWCEAYESGSSAITRIYVQALDLAAAICTELQAAHPVDRL